MKRVLPLFAAFAASVLAANWLTNRYGFITILGVSFTAGTLAAGLGFGIRDALHLAGDRWRGNSGWMLALAAILVGGALSYAVAPALAVASAVAFTFSELADLLVFQPLRKRNWTVAVTASNLVAAFLDTVLFLWLAGFPIWDAVPGQMIGKAAMILPALPVVFWARRRQ